MIIQAWGMWGAILVSAVIGVVVFVLNLWIGGLFLSIARWLGRLIGKPLRGLAFLRSLSGIGAFPNQLKLVWSLCFGIYGFGLNLNWAWSEPFSLGGWFLWVISMIASLLLGIGQSVTPANPVIASERPAEDQLAYPQETRTPIMGAVLTYGGHSMWLKISLVALVVGVILSAGLTAVVDVNVNLKTLQDLARGTRTTPGFALPYVLALVRNAVVSMTGALAVIVVLLGLATVLRRRNDHSASTRS